MHAIPGAAHEALHPLQTWGGRVLLSFILGVLLLRLPWAYPVQRAAPWIAGSVVLFAAGVLCWYRVQTQCGIPESGRSVAPAALIVACLAGYGWGCWHIGRVLDAGLPNCVDAVPRAFELEILEVPAREIEAAPAAPVARFSARVWLAEDPSCPGLGRHQVRLTWYDPPELQAGQRWQVAGRLRPPWGYRNPAGFDYERWLLGQRLNGTGYVREGRLISRAGIEPRTVATLRESVREAIQQRRLEWDSFILALMIGDDSAISASEWQALRDSGTVHLLVVSGLHVGMIAGLLFQVGRLLARLCPPLLLAVGSRRVASALALTGSAAYVWLSGAGVPAVRAWLMSAMVLLLVAAGRSVSLLRIFILVLGVVVVANPLVVHQQGFWLSFAAVLSLVAYFEPRWWLRAPRWTSRGLVATRQLFTMQILLFVALSPLLASEQASVPAVAPLVNAFAVPVVTLLILPLVLLGGPLLFLLPALAEPLLQGADQLIGWVMATAEYGAGVQGVAMGVQNASEWMLLALVVSLLGGAHGWRNSLMLTALWWAILLPDGAGPAPGAFRVTALDVGQGSAIVVETSRHRLLFDTGATYPSGFDLGEAVVVPSLRRRVDPRLDALILSHDDMDHTGGGRSVDRALAPRWILASFTMSPSYLAAGRVQRCRKGLSWRWDGVWFRFLHPPEPWRGSDNDGSCVLLIESTGRRALIAGDVSAQVERRLEKLPVDLAFAPHHGSATSSSPSFVRGYQPRIVFISTDRRSRYGHPHPHVLARYRSARVFVTGRDGALRWESDRPSRVVRTRSAAGAYWHALWPAEQGPVSAAEGADYRDGG